MARTQDELGEPCKRCHYGKLETDKYAPCNRCVNSGNGEVDFFEKTHRYETRSNVAETLEIVGDGVFFLEFAKAVDMPDGNTRKAFSKAVAALKEFRRLVNPCGPLDLSNPNE